MSKNKKSFPLVEGTLVIGSEDLPFFMRLASLHNLPLDGLLNTLLGAGVVACLDSNPHFLQDSFVRSYVSSSGLAPALREMGLL